MAGAVIAFGATLIFGLFVLWHQRRHRRKRNEELRRRGYGFLNDPEDDK